MLPLLWLHLGVAANTTPHHQLALLPQIVPLVTSLVSGIIPSDVVMWGQMEHGEKGLNG